MKILRKKRVNRLTRAGICITCGQRRAIKTKMCEDCYKRKKEQQKKYDMLKRKERQKEGNGNE